MKQQVDQMKDYHITKIKLCGLRRPGDIACVNALAPEYIGFVFAKNSRRYIAPENAAALSRQLNKEIIPVGVFVNEKIDTIVDLLNRQIIEAVQLHGNEDEAYMQDLRKQKKCTIIKVFQIKSKADIAAANQSTADYVLLDSGGGLGETFDWSLIQEIKRPYFLAGGLNHENVKTAIADFHPFAVDASSSLETDGYKDNAKMMAFVNAVRQRKD